ncbi:hypothetical protein [uncultured Vibrio sp.]|uniref:hypothetical protein n=1 Tax=uncultured Vibrio sp. TaxID=114054 RepID=UPI0025CD79E1|nr:hypothetical protein [uncultured Vibrio sp.]
MKQLTPQQENSLASFKDNLHLPNDGFHTLIIELSKEYQLPFQKVRKALIKSQKAIETKIRNEFDDVVESDLSKENWLILIHLELKALAESNQSVLDKLSVNENYLNALALTKNDIGSENDREAALEELYLAYEKVVFKPLLSMLHTSPLYWKLMRFEELYQMTEEHRQLFVDYPEHMEAAKQLFQLDKNIRHGSISTK